MDKVQLGLHVINPLQLDAFIDREKPIYFSILGQNSQIQVVVGGKAASEPRIHCLKLVFFALAVNCIVALALAGDL